MSNAILCIGSNVAGAVEMIGYAIGLLSTYGCTVVRRSDIYQSSSPYFNLVAEVDTDLDAKRLLALTKQIELCLGRTRQMKPLNIVPVDIDIVKYEDQILRPEDFNAPYFVIGYRQVSG